MTKTMLICSTNHQVVNIIPAITENVEKIIIFTTEFAKRSNWTKNLIHVLTKRGFKITDIFVPVEVEEEVDQFSELIKREMKKIPNNEILLNVGGGQKTFTMAMMKAFRELLSLNSRIVYTEANKHTLFSISKEMATDAKQYEINLSLDEIFSLYGFCFWNKSKTSYPNQNATNLIGTPDFEKHFVEATAASAFLKKDRLFKEIFFRKMMDEDEVMIHPREVREIVKKMLQEIKPSLKQLKISYSKGHDPATINHKIKNLSSSKRSDIKKLLESIYAPHRYNAFWNAAKNQIINYVFDNIMAPNVKLRVAPFTENEKSNLYNIWSKLGKFNKIEFERNGFLLKKNVCFSEKNGDLFEKMVLIEVLKLKEKAVWNNIHEIWLNVFTQKDDGEERANSEAEYDLVIVTKFGTLILLESKSAKFDNKIAKGQERDAFQKSGPYGRAIITGPLLKEIKAEKDPIIRKNKFPYVADAFLAQSKKVENAGMTYWCFDEISEKLEKLLH